jgi:Holliday junction resolvase RusA-like endonuclease
MEAIATQTDRLRIRVPAVPVAQPRARATQGRNGHARVHEVTTIKNADGSRKAHPIVAFKATVRLAVERAYQGPPLTGPLRVDVTAVFPRPNSMIWKTKLMPRERHIKKPDRDNLDKAVLDSLKDLLWVDDCQVCAGEIEKWIAAGDEQPHVEITITRIHAPSLF